jgi:hypothetical protein
MEKALLNKEDKETNQKEVIKEDKEEIQEQI